MRCGDSKNDLTVVLIFIRLIKIDFQYGGMSSNPTYDILGHPMGQGRPISSRPDELRTSSQQQQQQQAPQMNQPSQYQYQHTPMQPFYANLGMPYYPVIGQRNPNGN